MEYLNDGLRLILIVVSVVAARLFWRLSQLFKKDVFGPIYQILAYGFLAFAAGHLVQVGIDLANLHVDNLDLDLPVEIIFVSILLVGLYRIRNIGDDTSKEL
jgi:hypothetical protein